MARGTRCGETVEAGALHDSAATLRDDVRAIASSISPALFVEKVRVEVTEPARPGLVVGDDLGAMIDEAEIGRASGRERVCQYASISVVAVSSIQKSSR